jgi:peptidoglycan hydrolase-like protein with peptidoglycan-binding domain
MAEDGATGAIALGLLAAGIGILGVNYAMSDPGKSWIDQIKGKLASKDEGSHELPPARRIHGEEGRRRVLPAGSARQAGPPVLPELRAQARAAIPRIPRGPIRLPQMVSPSMAAGVARRMNAVFGTNFRTDGITTKEMQESIKSVQQQLGLPESGFPDARLLAQLEILLTRGAERAHQAPAATTSTTSPISDAAKVISKTFGGPPSTPVTGPDEGVKKTQEMLNAYFKGHALNPDGYLGPLTTGAIKEFQKSEGLQDTGKMDDKTHDLLVRRTSNGSSWLSDIGSWFSHKTGAAGGDDWKAETQDLPQFSKDVIDKVISTETNPRTLKSIGKVLGDAGYPKAAAAVLAKAGGATAASGYYPDPYYGVYPLAHGPWWMWE